jgi:putative DNA primase/helicase
MTAAAVAAQSAPGGESIPIPVFDTKYAKGWPENEIGDPAKYTPLAVALTARYRTDAHFAVYSVPNIRRRLATPEVFARLADGLVMCLFAVDVDAPEKKCTDAWWDEQKLKIDQLLADHPGAFVYRTKGGYRMIYVLIKPEVLRSEGDAARWKRRYLAWLGYLKSTYDIDGDPACQDWTRLYRLPHTVRDGKPQELDTIGRADAIGGWDVAVDLHEQTTLDGHDSTRIGAAPTKGHLAEGERHPYMLSIAGGMRRMGAGEAEILAALGVINRERCNPPKPDSDILGIARFVLSKPPGTVWTNREVPPQIDDTETAEDIDAAEASSIHDEQVGVAADDIPPRPVDAPPHAAHTATPSMPMPDIDEHRLNEIANALRLARMNAHRLRYVHAWGKWLVWDGRRWRRDDRGEDMTAAKRVAGSLYTDAAGLAARAAAGDARAAALAEPVAKWARTSSKASSCRAMLALAQSENPIAATASEFDRDPFALNVLNGTLDLRTGQLHPHRQTDLITRLAPVTYDAHALCPQWDRFLAHVLPDPEVRAFVQRFIGYCLTGDVSEQALAFLFGLGANGKSVLLDIMIALLGDYACRAAPDLVLAKHGEAHPTEIADLEGRRLVVCSEIEQGRAWSEATLKRITGDTTIKARHMKEDFYEFTATHKLLIAANTRPTVRETSNGFWRRMRLVPFEVTIPKDKQDKTLIKRILAEESPSVLSWAVAGCRAWQRTGLGEPAAVIEATDKYRKEQDVLGLWITDECVVGPGLSEFTTRLHTAFTTWCHRTGRHPWTRETMRDRLLERPGISAMRTSIGRGLSGIALVTPRDPNEEGPVPS